MEPKFKTLALRLALMLWIQISCDKRKIPHVVCQALSMTTGPQKVKIWKVDPVLSWGEKLKNFKICFLHINTK